MSEKSGCFCFLRVKVSSDQNRPKEGCRKWTKDPGGVKGAPQTHWQANYLEVFLKWEFFFRKSGREPDILHFNPTQGNADALVHGPYFE